MLRLGPGLAGDGVIGTLLGLALRQRRTGLTRLALIAAASGFATLLVLLAAATWQASGRQQSRVDKLLRPYPIPWIDDGNGSRHSNAVRSVEIAGGPSTGYQTSTTRLAGRDLLTIRLATGGPDAPVPPGIKRLPTPGEAVLSPALAELSSGDWSILPPGVKAMGTVSRSVLRAPDQLVLMLGVVAPVGVMNTMEWAVLTSFSPPRGNPSDGRSSDGGQVAGSRLAAAVTATGLLIALLAFVASAGQFALVSRERRFAAMALAGGAPRQVRLVAALESGIAAFVGSVAGLAVTAGLLWLRGDDVSLLGYSAFRRDLVLPWWVLTFALFGVALLSAVAAAAGARRPARRPMEVRQGARPRRFLDRLPGLGIGLLMFFLFGLMAFVSVVSALLASGVYLLAIIVAYLAISTISTALTLRVAERLRDGRHPAGVIAGSRVTSGYGQLCRTFVLAAFALVPATVIAVVDTSEAATPRHADGRHSDIALWSTAGGRTDANAHLANVIRDVPGVRAVAEIHRVPGIPDNTSYYPPREAETANCAALAAARASTPSFVCPNGAVSGSDRGAHRGQTYAVPIRGQAEATIVKVARVARSGWVDDASIFVPPALLPRNAPKGEVLRLEIRTDGTAATARRVTLAAQAVPDGVEVRALALDPVASGWSWRGRGLVFLAVLLILAAGSLALVAIEGVLERRRSFSTLTAQGASPATLARAAALEVAVPGLTAIVTGVLVGLAIGVPITVTRDHVSFASSEVSMILGAGIGATLLATGAVALATLRFSTIDALRGPA